MGMLQNQAGNSLKKALRKGQVSTKQYAQQVKEQQDEIIDKMNWIMKAVQKIADASGIELDDPLEE